MSDKEEKIKEEGDEKSSVKTDKKMIGPTKIMELPFHTYVDSRHKKNGGKWKEQRVVKGKPLSWGSITHDILVHIYQFLSLHDMGQAAMVCRNWNTVYHFPELWRKFDFRLAQSSSSHLKSTPKGLIEMVLQYHANHLRFVTIQMDNNKKSAEMAYEILSKLVHCSLKTLELMSTAIPAVNFDKEKFVSALTVIFVNSNSLSTLALDDMPVDDPSLETLAKSNQDSLKLLSMDSCHNASSRGITFVADQCRQLHELTIDYSHLTDDLLLSLSKDEHVKLKQLRINIVNHEHEEPFQWHTISSHSWESLARHSPQLVLIMYFYVLNDEDYLPFFLSPIPVTHVYFGRSVSRDVLGRISQYCKKLTELVICANGYNLLDSELINIAENCSSLCSLGLGECEISCSGMVEIAKICGSRLTYLFVRESTVVDDDKFDITTMQEEVSKYLERQWNVECMPWMDC